ncbi:beta-ribofuranosylaminobenzene 5'-phosphate synthase family protein [Salinirubrum litoreum]|uniref:Beta-ribofuranosylaminobenzene 5'-phosphate synthase n=1 Tax=Salinirubrum litoreum TaxID=1126234 RepID=A0ABD5RA46_9EURY|nr:beta-ribofuranosylaminobenzene 5'-phosphate synthase family protein [Salinirubrum litoreum]
MTRVSVGGRLHFGFLNLALSRERLYGGLGVALAEPRVVLDATRADGVDCDHPDAREYVERAVELLDVPGASVTVAETLPRHHGLGSGTQLALATLTAVAEAWDRDPQVRARAPDLGRGGRSGVGVGTFEAGGFVLDAGHPTTRFTTDRPADGEWTVPAVAVRHTIPDDWRFLLVLPDAAPGRDGDAEDASMRSAVDSADPELGDRISGIVTRRLLPALAEERLSVFGEAVAEIGRLNGAWYADQQGGVYRPPVGAVVEALSESSAITGAGQSSWGPAVYGVTDTSRAGAAVAAGEAALERAGVGGEVRVVSARNHGARVE